jgi:hypothetical protein
MLISISLSLCARMYEVFFLVNEESLLQDSEIEKKNTLTQLVSGYNVGYTSKSKAFHIGNTFVYTQYSRSILKNTSTYNQFDFKGNNNFTTSIDYSYNIKNFDLFGEAAISKSGGTGFLNGVIVSLSPTIDVSTLYRNYSKNFHSF